VASNASTWTAYANATVAQSDAFALYPLWPSEMVSSTNASDATIAIARSSFATYFGSGIGARPVLVYPAAVRAGVPNALAKLARFVATNQQPSFMPTAPGGGTENVGAVVALNDMLVQCPNGQHIELFPVWDRQSFVLASLLSDSILVSFGTTSPPHQDCQYFVMHCSACPFV
jgi:hypothetical protein